jgi:hypothetical protein
MFGDILGGILAGFFCKYVVMPNVPHYYETLLESVREDFSLKNSILNNSIHSPLLSRGRGTGFNASPGGVLNRSTILRGQTAENNTTHEHDYLNPPEFNNHDD